MTHTPHQPQFTPEQEIMAEAMGLRLGAEPPGDLQKPRVFVQWKGTDACFDFACECGAHHHFDGYFAYFVKCGSCETVWEMPIHLYLRKADPDSEPQVVLGDWQEDE